MNIVLIGYRGAGKSSIGRALAERLGKPFVDTDTILQERAGRSIRQIFEEQGERVFREHEARAVQAACLNENAVISVGGGAVMNPDNAARLRDAGRIVWLRAPADVLWQRICGDEASDAQRPRLTFKGGLEEIVHKLAQREPVYESLADQILDTDRLSMEAAVYQIIQSLAP
jgi:shikimate kinase